MHELCPRNASPVKELNKAPIASPRPTVDDVIKKKFYFRMAHEALLLMRPTRKPTRCLRPLIISNLVACLLFPCIAQAQGSTDHIPGKVYVIRITPFQEDSTLLEDYMLEKVHPVLSQAMFSHIKENLYSMRAAADGRWFVGYFHADRQEKDVLMRDSDLLTWLLHGHDVQIMPIESVRSPIEVPLTTLPDK